MKNQSNIFLKHCPFCGKGKSIVELYQNEYNLWTIGCGACGSHSGVSKKKEQVIMLWNSRPDSVEFIHVDNQIKVIQ
jgi:Lar family restriction alleviation protein